MSELELGRQAVQLGSPASMDIMTEAKRLKRTLIKGTKKRKEEKKKPADKIQSL